MYELMKMIPARGYVVESEWQSFLKGISEDVKARRLALAWIATRLLMATLCFTYHGLPGDLHYYYDASREHSLLTGMPEYPFVIAVALMAPARVLPFLAYAMTYGAVILIADAIVTRSLVRRVGRGAARRWIALVSLHGPLMLVRFDVWVALALMVSLIFAVRSPTLSGSAVAFAAAVKFWPAVFGFGLIGPASRRIRHMAAALAGGLAWVVLTVSLAGFDRLVSPLTWQGERGFEIESLWGSLLGLERVFGKSVVTMTKRQGSWEYTGQIADQLMWLVRPTQHVGCIIILVLLSLGLRSSREGRRSSAALTMAAVVGVFILTSPVISPQYVVWIVPCIVFVDDRRIRYLAAMVLALTQLEFPVLFDGIFSHIYGYEIATRLAIVVRNLVLAWATGRAVRLVVRRADGGDTSGAPRRAARGSSGPTDCGGLRVVSEPVTGGAFRHDPFESLFWESRPASRRWHHGPTSTTATGPTQPSAEPRPSPGWTTWLGITAAASLASSC